jgi:hypothetical protein
MKVIDVFEILGRGIDNEKNLSESEWPFFIVSYLESFSDTEGWDNFFTYSMNWYPELSQALEMVGDSKFLKR